MSSNRFAYIYMLAVQEVRTLPTHDISPVSTMNDSHWQTWPCMQWFLNRQQRPPPFVGNSLIPSDSTMQPLSQPPILPAGYNFAAHQISPSSGRSLPARYQKSYGRRQAASPYQHNSAQESLETVRRDYPTGTYLGMAQIGATDSGAGGVWRPQPVVEASHAGLWTCTEETPTDSVHADYYEVPYEGPQRMLILQSILYWPTLYRGCPRTSMYNFLIVCELSHICLSSCSFHICSHDSIDKPHFCSTGQRWRRHSLARVRGVKRDLFNMLIKFHCPVQVSMLNFLIVVRCSFRCCLLSRQKVVGGKGRGLSIDYRW